MISYPDCEPINNHTDPCQTSLPHGNNNTSNGRCSGIPGYYRSAKCYRPLQQIYKTIYSPVCGNRAARMTFTCICRPSERYTTTNMNYGSFHYNNWAFMQKNRPIDHDRQLFIKCYDDISKQRMTTREEKSTNPFVNAYNADEMQCWTQPTSDSCCPTDCCNDAIASNNCVC